MIRYAHPNDREAWFTLNEHLPESGYDEKVRNRQGYVCVEDGKIIGVLRYGLFWDLVPFCNLLFLDEKYRGRGYGKRLMQHWENEMKAAGCGMVMVSTPLSTT